MSLKEDLNGKEKLSGEIVDKDEMAEAENDELIDKNNKEDVKQMFIEENRGDPGHVKQILTVSVISLGCFIHGTSVVWPIVLSSLMSDVQVSESTESTNSTNTENYYKYPIDPILDVPWIVSIFVLGNFIGSLINAPLSNSIGRKWTCILGIGMTFSISFILVIVAVEVRMLYLSRVVMGIAMGISVSVSTIYIQDIATPDIRGSLGAIPGFTGALGVFSFQVLNAFMHWWYLNIFCACLSLPYMILMFFVPESPVYLVSRNKITEARFALARIRGSDWDLASELEEVKSNLEKAGSSKSKSRMPLSAFFHKTVLIPVLFSFVLLVLMNLSGIMIVMNYTVQIFISADSSINEFYATVYVGIALLISNILTVFLAKRLPRRRMLIISALGISITLGILGMYFQLKEWTEACRSTTELTIEEEISNKCDYGNIGWLPLASLMVFIFVYNLGYGAMVFITAVEILPTRVKEVGMSVAMSLNCAISFLVTYTFPILQNSQIGAKGCFWLYGAVSFIGFILLIVFLPETQGKGEKEIQDQIPGCKTGSKTCASP